MSLLQIQQQEQDYLERAKKPAMRSFTEILEQEERDRKEAERTAEEIEFDRYLQEQVARNEGAGAGAGGGRGKDKGKPRGGQRKVPNRGKAPTPAATGPARTPATARIDDDLGLGVGASHAPPSGSRGRGGRGGGGGGGRGRGGPAARGGANGHGINGNAPAFISPATTQLTPTAAPFTPNRA
jgi:hypothetical protein